MRIIVCVKQVPDTSVPVDFDFARGGPKEEDAVYVMNPHDEHAVEEALSLRERMGGRVVAISLGPPRVEAMLRLCLAMGADRAIHLRDEVFDQADAYGIGVALARTATMVGYDLILCGAQSCDSANGQVGATIAEILKLPAVSKVSKVQLDNSGDSAVLRRRVERGDEEIVECSLPAVLTIHRGINEIRYPTLPARLAAREAEILVRDAAALGLTSDEVGLNGSLVKTLGLSLPRPKPKKLAMPDPRLSVQERMKALLEPAVSRKKEGEFIEESCHVAAARILEFLREQERCRDAD